MAMNKTEKALFDGMKESLAMACALRWPDLAPQPMSVAEIELEIAAGRVKTINREYGGQQKVVVGWNFNEYRGDVFTVATTAHNGGEYSEGMKGPYVSFEQNRPRIFRHKIDALAAMRYAMTMKYAKHLADLDSQIQEADANG